MASSGRFNSLGLRVNTNVRRKGSTSFLVSPDHQSASPQFSSPQFRISPAYSYAHREDLSQSLELSRNNSWQERSIESCAPLLPTNRRCGGNLYHTVDSSVHQSNFVYGVGDLENIRIDGSMPKTYDYADYGHQYEELPNRKSIAKCPVDSGVDSRSELYQSSGGASVMSDAGDMANIVNNNAEKRKRVNPLYDAMTQSMPSIYNKKDVKDEMLRRQVRCLKCALVVLVIVSVASLAVSLYALINYTMTKDDADPVLTPKVQKLSDNYSQMEELLASFEENNDTMIVIANLIKKVNMIEGNLTSKVALLQDELDKQTEEAYINSQDIIDTRDNLTSIISSLNLTVQLQLHAISKQEGPRGPQGVANFSQCSYSNVSNDAAASDNFPNLLVWTPTENSLETNIAIYAACTVDGGTGHEIEINPITPIMIQYRCKCWGVVPGKDRRICYTHILSCPRETTP